MEQWAWGWIKCQELEDLGGQLFGQSKKQVAWF